MSSGSRELSVGTVIGATIEGVFGLAWAEWGASGLTGTAEIVVRAFGLALGLAVVVRSIQLRDAFRKAGLTSTGPSMFSSRGYLLTVLAEVIGLVGGALVLGDTGQGEYAIAWVAAVVGLHFVVFGKLFTSVYYWLGGALIAAGIAGALVGVTGAGANVVTAVSGLAASAAMLVAGGRTVLLAGSSLRSSAEGGAPSHV